MSFNEKDWMKKVDKATTGKELLDLLKEIPDTSSTTKEGCEPSTPVSYTHLDVYKRQVSRPRVRV